MEITFQTQADDLIALQKFHEGKGAPRWVVLAIIVVVMIGAQAVGFFEAWRRSDFSSRAIQNFFSLPTALALILPLVFFVSFWFFIQKVAPRSQAQQLIRDSPVFSNPQTMRLEPTGIFRRDASGEAIWYWSSIYDIAQSEQQIFFFTEKNAATVIPKRAFTSPQDAAQFFNQAIEFWKAGGGNPPAPPIPAPHSP